MAKFTDFSIASEVTDMMERMVKRFPVVFQGFDVTKVKALFTHGKKAGKFPAKLHPVKYPEDVWLNHVYTVQVFSEAWQELTPKQKALVVFHLMCSIPEGGFDPESKLYGKKRKPDYNLFAEEFAVAGTPDWLENGTGKDPMGIEGTEAEGKTEKAENDGIQRVPVTEKDVVEAATKTE